MLENSIPKPGSLAIRLAVWFLVLSIFPLAILAYFVRNTVHDSITSLSAYYQMRETDLYAQSAGEWKKLFATNRNEDYQPALVDLDGIYVIHQDLQKVGKNISTDLPASIVARVLSGEKGQVIENGYIISYVPLSSQGLICVGVGTDTIVQNTLRQFEATAYSQFIASIFLAAIASGVVIWLVVGLPLRELAAVAKQIGHSQADSLVEVERFDDELEILAYALNDSHSAIRKMVLGLEGNVANLQFLSQALQQSEQRFRTIFNSVSDAILVISIQTGQIVDVNDRMLEMYQLARDEVPAITIGEISSGETGYDQDTALTWIYRTVEEGTNSFEWQAKDKTGKLFWVNVTTRIVQLNGETRLLATVRDISEQKQARDEINQLNAELEQRVIERTSQLETANKELEAFSYSVSHDLRAPLRALNGYSSMLEENYASQLPEEGRYFVTTIQKNAQQMGRLIDDLLSFSRLGRQPLNKQMVDPLPIIREVLETLQSEFIGRKVELTIGELGSCYGDPGLLKQVWINLLSNALKFTRKRELACIEIGHIRQNKEDVYFIRDNGVGFDMQYANKLFGVFQRLHSATEYDGTGVGLPIVQRIVARHDGRVWAEAAVDQGATFYFGLPLE